MKTLEDIKEYFKDALIVESITIENKVKGSLNNTDERGIHEWSNAFWFFDKETYNICLYDNDAPILGIAKIIKKKRNK